MSRSARTLLSAAASVVVTAGLAVAVGPPAHAVTTQAPCTTTASSGVTVCAGIQTTGGDVRGYARGQVPAGKRISVVRVELQRRACGGSWAGWTTRTAPDDGARSDSLVTTWVARPGGYQFRTRTRMVVTNRGSGTAYGVDRTSRAFGAC